MKDNAFLSLTRNCSPKHVYWEFELKMAIWSDTMSNSYMHLIWQQNLRFAFIDSIMKIYFCLVRCLSWSGDKKRPRWLICGWLSIQRSIPNASIIWLLKISQILSNRSTFRFKRITTIAWLSIFCGNLTFHLICRSTAINSTWVAYFHQTFP